jgi:hypothetical protein
MKKRSNAKLGRSRSRGGAPGRCAGAHIPFWQFCPAWQQLLLPHTVVPVGQQPPEGWGVPWQPLDMMVFGGEER